MAHGYGFDQPNLPDGTVGDGTGQTIAIVDAFDAPNIYTDLQVFDAQWGLPDPNFTVAMPQGQPAYNSGWAGEIALDVEWAHAIAPGANIVLVEALNNGYGSLLGAVDYAAQQTGASVVSMSWGSGEFSAETSSFYDGRFAGYSNLTFVASSGDRGAPPSWPAVSPNVVAVGGTSLNLDFGGNYISETGWSGSGGGISNYESQPSYQNGVVDSWSTTKRTSPDVAYNANPNTGVYVRFNNAWYAFGGTSAGAPQWAALIAIADEGRAELGSNPLGSQDTLNALYSLNGTADFNDITSGTSTGSPHYSAGPGYDLVTGIGSPNANSLIPDLENWTSPFNAPSQPPGGAPAHPVSPTAPHAPAPHAPQPAAQMLAPHDPAASTAPITTSATTSTASLQAALTGGTTASAAPAAVQINSDGGLMPLANRTAASAWQPDGMARSLYNGQVAAMANSRSDDGTGTASAADNAPAPEPQQRPAAIESQGVPADQAPASFDALADGQIEGAVPLSASDACFAGALSFAGGELDVALPLVADDGDAAIGAAAIAVVLGGYYGVRFREQERRAHRLGF